MAAAETFNPANAPGRAAIAVTPHDTNTFAQVCRGIYVGTTGDVVVTMVDGGNDVTFKTVPAGAILPVSAIRVKNTSTTASNMVAFF
jgi:hypothetical protein